MPALKRILLSEDSELQLGSLVSARLGRLFTAYKLGHGPWRPLMLSCESMGGALPSVACDAPGDPLSLLASCLLTRLHGLVKLEVG